LLAPNPSRGIPGCGIHSKSAEMKRESQRILISHDEPDCQNVIRAFRTAGVSPAFFNVAKLAARRRRYNN
jgi:hypothetical protein